MKFKSYPELLAHCQKMELAQEIPTAMEAGELYAKVCRMNPDAIEQVVNLCLAHPEPTEPREEHAMMIIEIAHEFVMALYQ